MWLSKTQILQRRSAEAVVTEFLKELRSAPLTEAQTLRASAKIIAKLMKTTADAALQATSGHQMASGLFDATTVLVAEFKREIEALEMGTEREKIPTNLIPFPGEHILH